MIRIKNIFSKTKKRELETAIILAIGSFSNETGLIVSEIHYRATIHTSTENGVEGYDPFIIVTAIAP